MMRNQDSLLAPWRSLLSGMAVLTVLGAAAQPANDNPCGAEVLTANATCTYSTWSNVAATATAGTPAPGCASYVGGDVWFQLILPTNGSVTVTTNVVTGSTFTDGGMAFYNAASCSGPFTLVACDDDTGPGLMPALTYAGTPGSTLWIRVWEYGNNAFGAFNICATLPPPPATNNEPCNATVLTPAAACAYTTGTNVGATATTGPANPTCSSYAGGDIWFSVTVPTGGTVTITADVSSGSAVTDMGMAIHTAATCSGPFVQAACDDDSGPGLMPMLTYTGVPGSVVWVRLWEYGNNAFGPFSICATIPAPPPPPPANNEPCTTTSLTVPVNCGFTTYTNVGATSSLTTPAPGCGAFGTTSRDIWFAFVAPQNGIAIIETQAGTLTDAAMALYADAPPLDCTGPFTLVQCDDDSGPGLMPFLSFTTLTPGGTYYLRVWGYSSGAGSFGLCMHSPAPASGGTCVHALQLYDSFGDGWGSSSVGISINGGAATNYTITGQYNIVLLGLDPGDVLVVTYNATGPGQADNSYRITLFSGGSTIFYSGVPPTSGVAFSQTVTCQPPPAPPSDCAGGTTVCSGQSFNNNSNNTGNVADLTAANQGCISSGERQGTWYYFSPSASGTVGFTIAPSAPTDYDFAVWGPMSGITCPPSGAPLRCSYSSLYTNTGLGNGATDQTEGAGGDAFVSPITVSAGQLYVLYVDNFSSNGQAFSLTWNLSNGASLDCTVLPIELLSFTATAVEEGVRLDWATASENNSDRFEIERSLDSEHFERIGTQAAGGNSTQERQYEFVDRSPYPGINYYRLRAVDQDNAFEHSPVEAVTVERPGQDEILFAPNPGSDLVRVVVPENTARSFLIMTDAGGREVLHMRTESDRFVVNLVHLKAGIYQARLLSAVGEMLAHGSWVRE